MPDTRPDQYLSNEGVCNACLSFEFQKKIDWNQRKSDLLKGNNRPLPDNVHAYYDKWKEIKG